MNKFNIFFKIFFSCLIASICDQFINCAKPYDLMSLERLSLDLEYLSRALKTKAQPTPTPVIAGKPTIIDFYTPLCGPCKEMLPIFEKLEHELGSKYIFKKVNMDESRFGDQFGVDSVPTFVFLKNDKMVGKVEDAMTEKVFRSKIIEYLEPQVKVKPEPKIQPAPKPTPKPEPKIQPVPAPVIPVKPTIIDFYSTLCGPCKKFAPIFDKLALELGSKYTFKKSNVQEEGLYGDYGIRSVPTFVFLKDNKVVHKIVGAKSENEFRQAIATYLG